MAKNVTPWTNVGPLSGPTIKPGTKEARYRNSDMTVGPMTPTAGPGKNVKFIPDAAHGADPMPTIKPTALKNAAARKFKLNQGKRSAKTMKLGVNAVQENRVKNSLRKKAAPAQGMTAPVSRSAAVRRLAYK